MHILELVFPGTWLDYEDRDFAVEINGLIGILKTNFIHACLAVSYFEKEKASLPSIN